LIGNNISIYPNPVADFLTVKTLLVENTTIDIVDVAGKLIQSQSSISTNGEYRINMQNVSPGIYFVNVTSGNFNYTSKIVK